MLSIQLLRSWLVFYFVCFLHVINGVIYRQQLSVLLLSSARGMLELEHMQWNRECQWRHGWCVRHDWQWLCDGHRPHLCPTYFPHLRSLLFGPCPLLCSKHQRQCVHEGAVLEPQCHRGVRAFPAAHAKTQRCTHFLPHVQDAQSGSCCAWIHSCAHHHPAARDFRFHAGDFPVFLYVSFLCVFPFRSSTASHTPRT
jgi:hypothetical protein